MSKQEFTVLIDTREQQPWTFAEYVTASKKLETGDYAIKGLEDILCIERKRGVAEIANNISENRFIDVINRMTKYKYAFILIECDYDQLMTYPVGSDIPKEVWNKLKLTPQFILKFISELQIKHNIHTIFCGCPLWAEKTALSIMKRVYEIYGKK